MTVTDLGLGGNPVNFLGAYVRSVSASLGLTQNPSTCTVTLTEDEDGTPAVLFTPPDLGSYHTIYVGSRFRFSGVITGYNKDISNISGRSITVNISDVREIMKGIPMIMAPGFRAIANKFAPTSVSLIDAYGAYDDYEYTGLNLSGWNQAGMTYQSISRALGGGTLQIEGIPDVHIPAQVGKAFGEQYVFDMSEVDPFVDPLYRVNTNLISVADYIQGIAQNHSFDWFVETEVGDGNIITVKIKTIDRRYDNIDLDLDAFLAQYKDYVVSAKQGYELRNEVANATVVGALIEQMRVYNIDGMAVAPLDLSEEGGPDDYIMSEVEMRLVMGSKEAWETWVKEEEHEYGNSDILIEPKIPPSKQEKELERMAKKNHKRFSERYNKVKAARLSMIEQIRNDREKRAGRIFEKLKGHADATYGKRFKFTGSVDVDYADAAWTADVVSGNSDPNEFFRNDQGKTRCFVEFTPGGFAATGGQAGTTVDVNQSNVGLGIGGGFTVGQAGAPVSIDLTLANDFDAEKTTVELDKANWFVKDGKLYVAATIEEGNIVRLEAGIFTDSPDLEELKKQLLAKRDEAKEGTAEGYQTAAATRAWKTLMHWNGVFAKYQKIHGFAYQPTYVHVPVRSKYNRYGPVYPSNFQETNEGKLEIIQDDGFSPWEFGSTQLMYDAMQFKVDNLSSSVKQVESADVVIEGFPRFSIGESLGMNSNISSIGISFGGQVTTTYRLQSFLRKFGELTKEELAALSYFARSIGNRAFPQDFVGFIDKYRTKINTQFSGRGTMNTSSTMGGASSFD